MARVAVVHNTLAFRGGADAVCLHVCEALDRDHDVTLFTLSGPPIADLNALFDTAADVTVRRPPGTALLGRSFEAITRVAGPQLPAQSALLTWYVRGKLDAYDAVVSTANEFSLPGPSVQYVHNPQFNAGGRNRVWTALAGASDLPADAQLVANSQWTADEMHRRYGREPSVLYPPVDPIPGGRPWNARGRGIVTVGRLAPDKRHHDSIRVVDGVRAAGYEAHLHLVGSTAPQYADYYERLRRAVARRPYVTLHADVPRAELERLLTANRYGLNTRPDEAFGMAVAEYVAAGMIPFVPDAGGQREVVDRDPDRLFGSLDEAVTKIGAAIDRGDRPRLARDRFASDRFHDAIRDHVERVL